MCSHTLDTNGHTSSYHTQSIMMARTALRQRSCTRGLAGLPIEVALQVWDQLSGDEASRRQLMQASSHLRQQWAPVISSLRISLPLLNSSTPRRSLLEGLHSTVRVSKLTIDGGGLQVHHKRKSELCKLQCNAISTLITSTQLSSVKELYIQNMCLSLKAAMQLSTLLHSVESLTLEGCLVEPGSLTIVGSCKHLAQLSLVRTHLAPGAGQALAVLAAGKRAGLKLTLEKVIDCQPAEAGHSPFSFLSLLAPCMVNCTAVPSAPCEAKAIMHALGQQQQECLVSLCLGSKHHVDGPAGVLGIEAVMRLAKACPQLQSLTCRPYALAGMQCLTTLVEMPHLRQLSVNSIKPTQWQSMAAVYKRKQPLSLHFSSVTPSQIAALPLDLCSDVWAKTLVLPTGQTREQLVKGMRATLQNAEQCKSVFLRTLSSEQAGEPAPGGGLSALSASCPIQAGHHFTLFNIALEADDILGLAAAWGTTIQRMSLQQCSLSDLAWAALASGSFPALTVLSFKDSCDPHMLAVQITMMCLGWPRGRRLTVQVAGEGASQVVSSCNQALSVFGRPMPEVTEAAAAGCTNV